MKTFWDEESHLSDFITLNNCWIEKYFKLEDNDRELTKDPTMILRKGGHVLTVTRENKVVGVCALFRESDEVYELARMAVAETEQGSGIGRLLLQEVIRFAKEEGAKKLFLISNTKLVAAVNLYKHFDFKVVSEGQHPTYRRGNIVMEKFLDVC